MNSRAKAVKNIRYEMQVLFPTPAFVQRLVLMKRTSILGSVRPATSLLTKCIEEEQDVYYCGRQILAVGVRSDAELGGHGACWLGSFTQGLCALLYANEELAFALRWSFRLNQ